MATSTVSPSTTQARLHLRRDSIVRLMEWQARAVAAGLPRPSYSDLIDALLTQVELDQATLVRLLSAPL